MAGSPAINAGDSTTTLTTDGRGTGYARLVGSKLDIGAYEVQAPPTVSKVTINNGDVQRSRVTAVAVTFNQLVSLPLNPADAFQLMRQSDSALPTLVANVDNSGQGTVVTLTFSAGPAVDFDSLADGRYTLTVDATKVANPDGTALDGDNNGVGGDDYVLASTPFGSGVPTNIFRYYGDITGDGSVATNDFVQFRQAFNGVNPIFDFDNDGAVAVSDFVQFRQRFNGSI